MTRLEYLDILEMSSSGVDELLEQLADVFKSATQGSIILAMISVLAAHLKAMPDNCREDIAWHTMDMIMQLSAVRKLDS
jgi:hypothetical protein